MTPRPFRFGAQANNARSAAEWRDLARRLEDQGFSSLLMPDHFDDQLAPMPALAMAAEATSELRVGSLVLDNDYKHPVVLAKEAATLDLLSGGRLELGIGAGWMKSDYDQSGIPLDRARVDEVELSVTIFMGAITADGRQLAEVVGSTFGQPADMVLDSPHLLAGTVEEIVDELQALRDNLGFSYVMFGGGSHEAMTPIV